MEPAPRMLQEYHRHGPVPIMRLDHFNCQVPDAAAATAWYQRELGFRVSEYTVKESPEGDVLWAAWLHRKQTVHDLALMCGIGPRLHHAGFWLPDALAVLRACDVLAAAGYHHLIERGPGRHGLSNALFLYLRDPDGNRIELYANDYLTADPDAKPIRWTLEDPRRATFWGHAAPPCWFEEAWRSASVLDGAGLMRAARAGRCATGPTTSRSTRRPRRSAVALGPQGHDLRVASIRRNKRVGPDPCSARSPRS